MSTTDEQVALERSRALALRPDWGFKEADTYARARVARDEALENLRTVLANTTWDDLVAEASDQQGTVNDGRTDAWGLDADGIDYDAALAERNADDDHRRAVAEYEASEAFRYAEAMRKGLRDANPGMTEEQVDALVPHKTPTRKAPSAKPAPVTGKSVEEMSVAELVALRRARGDA